MKFKLKKGISIIISIIIPVYKEKKINFFLKNLTELIDKDIELILVDGDTSSTLDLIEEEFQKSFQPLSSPKGRANQMNSGAKVAKGEILLFLHADTLLPKNFSTLIKDAVSSEEIKAGAFDLSFDRKTLALKLIAKVASIRSRLTRLPYGDQAIFIQKDTFKQLGGYENIPLMEDVNLMQKLKKHHYKIEILQECVVTSSRKWDTRGVVFTTLRNWVLVSLYFLGVSPKKLAKYYF